MNLLKKIKMIRILTWNFAHYHQQQTNKDLLQGSQHDVFVLGRFSQWITGVTVSLLMPCFSRKSIFILTLYVFYLLSTVYTLLPLKFSTFSQLFFTSISFFFNFLFPFSVIQDDEISKWCLLWNSKNLVKNCALYNQKLLLKIAKTNNWTDFGC